MLFPDIHTIGVVGAGQMGAGIAQIAAVSGLGVLLADASPERANAGKASIEKALTRLVEKGRLDAAAKQSILARIQVADVRSACAGADVVVEAVTENRELKIELFEQADRWARPAAILASNTSSVSISLLAGRTSRPERVIGMHFMNPVPLMKLCEVVVGLQTSAETLATVRALALSLEKTVVVSQDRPGFLVNRLLIPFLNEACFALEEGTGTLEDIDQAIKLGLNHPLGPFELADLIGLDTVLAIAEVLQRELGDDKYRPAVRLRNLVAAGWLGRKAGRGFYRYDAEGRRIDP
jgi:3-hydroxybutyryl-CoA dehydrogenase